jgi:hypothetical protein
MGVDPTVGLMNWSRYNRYKDDIDTDNGAIEILRCGDGNLTPDVQVAEYAAPILAVDLAAVATLLGRLYCGNSEMGEALCLIEIYPGPGLLTSNEMTRSFGYRNFYHQEYLNMEALKAAPSHGFTANIQTLGLLWTRFSHHYGKGLLDVNSNYLLNEMASLRPEPGKIFPQPSSGRIHDDRVRAIALCVWAARGWQSTDGAVEARAIDGPSKWVNPQASDMTSEEYGDWAEDRFSEMLHG